MRFLWLALVAVLVRRNVGSLLGTKMVIFSAILSRGLRSGQCRSKDLVAKATEYCSLYAFILEKDSVAKATELIYCEIRL